jgi:peptidyl-prolyl cis-trans isomerase SurA
MITQTREGKQAYRLLYIKSRTEPHKANLQQDYQRILEDARANKETKLMKDWVKKKVGGTYVWISDEYKSCKFENDWMGKR